MSTGVQGSSLDEWLRLSAQWIGSELEAHVPLSNEEPQRLHEAMRYSLFGAGKRIRPALLRLVCEHLGGAASDAVDAAMAIELVHTYSLVHDDLPCMDDDDLRRGRPTCHVVFGEDMAVLVGDALLTLAMEMLAREESARSAKWAAVLARAAGSRGMVGGQVLDVMSAEGEADVARVARIHQMKTAALFSAAAEMGAISAGGAQADCRTAAEYGRALGLCFQATDDLLDVTGDAATLGKTPGKDEAMHKATLVAVLGMEGARAEARRQGELAKDCASRLCGSKSELLLALVERVLERSA